MDAIIMAGGAGQRLGMEEKACVMLEGRPLISYVIDAMQQSCYVDNIFVQVSSYSPHTEQVVREIYGDSVSLVSSSGDNYIGDMVSAVRLAGSSGPVLLMMPDLPLITPLLIDGIIEAYSYCEVSALSVHIPLSIYRELDIRPSTVFYKKGAMLVPAGINILNADEISKEQAENDHVLYDPRLAMSIDSFEDLDRCSIYMKTRSVLPLAR